jgi:hypothetical protein
MAEAVLVKHKQSKSKHVGLRLCFSTLLSFMAVTNFTSYSWLNANCCARSVDNCQELESETSVAEKAGSKAVQPNCFILSYLLRCAVQLMHACAHMLAIVMQTFTLILRETAENGLTSP